MIVRTIYNNDLALVLLPNGLVDFDLSVDEEYIRQKLKHRLLFFLGEWFADTRQGFPYRQRVLVSNPNLISIRNLFYQAIQESPGIMNVNKLELDFDRLNRTLAVTFEATMDNGQTLSVDPRRDQDFIISVV